MDLIDEGISLIVEEMKVDPTHREFSWEHCYSRFSYSIKTGDVNNDSLSLSLAFYLASFGMYRGSSFLLNKDYLIHVPAVKIIVEPRYRELLGIKCNQYTEDIIVLLKELYKRLDEIYMETRGHKKESGCHSSRILITKVLLGTLGCMPALDGNVLKAMKFVENYKKGDDKWTILKLLIEFYNNHRNTLEEKRKQLVLRGTEELYPEMRVLDMGLWKVGDKLD